MRINNYKYGTQKFTGGIGANKQNLLEKDNLLKESLETHEMLTQQVRPAKDVLTEAKHVIWDSLFREIKKIKEHFVQVEYEIQLETS